MGKIVNQAEYDKHVNRENKAIIDDFLIEKRAEGCSSGTLTQYRSDLKIIAYIIYTDFENKTFTEMNRKDIRNLSIHFQERELSNARINRLLSAFRSALEFCTDDDDYDYEYNVGSRIKGLSKSPVREITFLTEEQIEWLLEKLEEQGDYLKAVYLSLSYYSAARKNEVNQVMKDGLTKQYFTNVVTGKGGKSFRLFYGEQTQRLIRKYMDERGDDDIPNLFVRVSTNGIKTACGYTSYSYWCEKFSKMLEEKEGKKIHINPHCFRHSRLENLSKSGMPLEKLKVLANHNDVSTTESYLSDRTEGFIAEIFGMDESYFTS